MLNVHPNLWMNWCRKKEDEKKKRKIDKYYNEK